jgi:hypothetical protein
MKAAANCLVAALFLSWFVPTQSASQNANQTDAFTALISMFGNQPDFTADAQVGGSRMKIARKNGKLRREWLNPSKSKHAVGGIYHAVGGIYHNVLLELPGSPAIALDPQLKIYAEVPSDQTPPDVIRRMIESVKNDPQAQCKVEKLGTERLDGHIVERTRMSPVSPGTDPGERTDFTDFYVARDLKNLVLKIEVVVPQMGEKLTYRLSKVSLDVPDEVFEMPSGYTKVDYKILMDEFRRAAARKSEEEGKGEPPPLCDADSRAQDSQALVHCGIFTLIAAASLVRNAARSRVHPSQTSKPLRSVQASPGESTDQANAFTRIPIS